MKKKCVFGGTFDPIHNGHLKMAEAAQAAFDLDEVVFMTAGDPYFKTGDHTITPAALRLAMTAAALADHPGFTASDLEVTRRGHTYTCDTLAELAAKEPDTRWYFMIGADCVATIHRWYRPDVIFAHAAVIAANRNDQIPPETLQRDAARLQREFGATVHLLDWEGLDTASSTIRDMVRKGEEEFPVPPAVKALIRANDLYQQDLDEDALRTWVQAQITPSRYAHTLGVAQTAEALARRYGESPRRARIAGLLHDCAKSEAGALEHGARGAEKARKAFSIEDEGILSAIATHTTGEPGMPLLSKILYVADYIEPGRDRAPRLSLLRQEAYEDLDLAICHIAEDTLAYLQEQRCEIDERTRNVYNYYKHRTQGPVE